MIRLMIFIVLLIVFFCNNLAAQDFTYFPLSVGNKWFFSDQGFESVIKLKLEVQKDTTLSDGYLYAKLNMFQVNSDGSFTLLEEGYSYLREENGKIIEYPERLILDYNMNIGDSVISFYNEPYSAILDTIVNKNVFNRNLKTYIFFSTEYDFYSYSDSIGFNTLWATTWQNLYPKYLLGCEIEGKVYGQIITKLGNKNELLGNYILSQNYPNPFNPVTKIKYFIPQISIVSVKVYNILGEEIETLVNEKKQIGNYEIEFNGSSLSSGVYLYKIQAGSFRAVRKFVIVK